MSMSTPKNTMARISSAPPGSPIAVFRMRNPDGEHLNSVFGATTETIKQIKAEGDLFLGNFNKTMDKNEVMATMEANVAR